MKLRTPEAVTLLARTHDFFPAAFRWRGRRFDVLRIELCWKVQQPAPCRLFQVRTAAGSFVLRYSLKTARWEMTNRPSMLGLLPDMPAAPARFPLPRNRQRAQRQPVSITASRGPKIAAATPKAPSVANSKAPAAQSLAMRASG